MSSAFFRRPGEDSSDTSSDSDDEKVEEVGPSAHRPPAAGEEEADLATTESLSSNASFSRADSHDGQGTPDIDQYRNLMLATLLEDFYKTRAAEMINANTPGANYNRQSPEVQALAHKLYTEASATLAANGLLPEKVKSEGLGNVRSQYLRGLDNLSLRQIQDTDLIPDQTRRQLKSTDNSLAIIRSNRRRGSHEVVDVLQEPMNSLIMRTGGMNISSPHADMGLMWTSQRRSHYESSFQQLKLLGKGGFGKVYHAFNLFDKKEYAVKKIPLSAKLSQRYKESGHQELETVLREVQALAQLDHRNVVRYHATWIEEPQTIPPPSYPMPKPRFQMPQQRLLANHATLNPPPSRVTAVPDYSDGIVFGSDSVSSAQPRELPEHAIRDWSSQNLQYDTTSAHESEIFTDGQARSNVAVDTAIDGSVYVLHVQMSMYPLTLAQYLSPPPSNSTSAPSSPTRRHCFHLVPALRILLGILCGLQYIHAKGLVHRDIKPSNIFISSNTATLAPRLVHSDGFHDVGCCAACPDSSSHHVNPRIGDFGLVAEFARSGHSRSNSHDFMSGSSKAVGTEFYRPPAASSPQPLWPDQNRPNSPKRNKTFIDEKLDVFALGIVLVELLYRCGTSSERLHVLRDLQRGKIPKGLGNSVENELEMNHHGAGQGEEAGRHAVGTGAKVEECIRGMIERDAAKRWSCAMVKDKVEEVLRGCCVRRKGHDLSDGRTDAEDGGLKKVRSLTGTEEAEVS